MGPLFFGFFLVYFNLWYITEIKHKEKKLRVAKGFKSRKWLQDIQLFLSKQKNPNLSRQIFFGTFFHVFEVDSAKTHENDDFIDATQRKKIGFAPNLAKMLYNPSSIKGNSCGAYCCLSASLRVAKSQNSPFPPSEPSNTWKKKVPKKICRLKFRFLCLDRKSWVSWSHFLDSKPFAALSFLAYAWFPKRHFIMVDSAKTRRKWWFYSFNSAKKGGVWAQFGRNALQYISNRGHLLGSLLLLVHIYSNGKNLKKTDQQKVSCILL